MKTLKFIKIYSLSALLLLATWSCSDFTDGIDQDPNNFTSAPGALLIGQANLANVKMHESQISRVSGIWTDQFTGDDRQYIALNEYNTTAGDYDDDWDDIYADGLAQARLAEEKGLAAGDDILVGVSRIIQGILIAQTASLWGDVPFSEALDYFSFPNPNYDSQSSVLQAGQDLLSSGISLVGTTKVADAYGSPVYVDNSATFAKVAHSAKARYYMTAKNYSMALAEARLGISSPDGDLLAAHTNATGAQNLYWQFQVEQRDGYLTVSNSYLRKLLDGEVARRLATPGDANRRAVYFTGTDLNVTDGVGYFGPGASFPIISWVETKLIEAEAAVRLGGSEEVNGRNAFNEVRNYLATLYGGAFPASSSSGNTLILEILEEKYISLIGGLAIYDDVRRTNNALGVPIKGTGTNVIPQRFLYPQIEINSNANFPGLVDLFTPTPVNQ
jgi:hypothetical protein